MKVLWLVNFPPINVAEANGLPRVVNEGWISGMSSALTKTGEVKLYICYSQNAKEKPILTKVNGIKFIGYYDKESLKVNWNLENVFARIIQKINPDVVHIMGTEYPHTLMMVRACKHCDILERCVISIQGLTSYSARYVESELPFLVKYGETPYSFLTRNSVHAARKRYEKSGIYEWQAIKEVKHVIGRTDWDRACAYQINPAAEYHFNNEVLRASFYSGKKWDINACDPCTIFVSQATYPLKGFHVLLEAFAEILKTFPSAVLKVAGYNRLMYKKCLLNRSPYELYLMDIIEKHNLKEHIVFLGSLNEEEMVEQYLKAHTHVIPSFIENSSNSLGEAMILGVPSVATDVGGTKNMVKHGEEGFLYQSDAPYMLSLYIKMLWEDDALAMSFSDRARARALDTHDAGRNAGQLMTIYKNIGKEK